MAHNDLGQIVRRIGEYYSSSRAKENEESVISIGVGESKDVIRILYRRPEYAHLIGLCVHIEPDGDDEVARIIADLGQPLGTFGEDLVFDGDGIGWWFGSPPEWWYGQALID